MGWFSRNKNEPMAPAVEARSATIENPAVPVSAENFMAFFGMSSVDLPRVTTESALHVPAVAAAVAFLSRTLAALPLHAYRSSSKGAEKLTGKLQVVVHENPNDEMDAFKFWQYFWQQVFTGGRGLAWIERYGNSIEALWPMDPTKVTVFRRDMRRYYRFEGKEYPAADVIDIPFMLKANQIQHFGPIALASKAIQLALAMNDYGSNFFAGGGVPPLSLEGPLPAGADAMKRAQGDIMRAIDAAKTGNSPVFPIPPGYKLSPVGIDPAKGQMIEARLFQVQEISRAWQLPPAFLQDLSKGTFANVEQQDLHLVKHLIGQWSAVAAGELNLKIFGRFNGNRYVEHNLDGLMRGDFKSRIEGLARGIQTALLTPNEGRALENRPRHDNPAADQLLVQGATIVLGSQSDNQAPSADNASNDNGDGNDDQAGV